MTRDALIRGVRTFVQTFVGIFGLALVGWLGQLAEWATNGGVDDLPSLVSLRFAAIAAAASAAAAVVSLVMNAVEDWRGMSGLFGAKARPAVQPPAGGGYPATSNGELGRTDPLAVALTVLVVVVLVIVLTPLL